MALAVKIIIIVVVILVVGSPLCGSANSGEMRSANSLGRSSVA